MSCPPYNNSNIGYKIPVNKIKGFFSMKLTVRVEYALEVVTSMIKAIKRDFLLSRDSSNDSQAGYTQVYSGLARLCAPYSAI